MKASTHVGIGLLVSMAIPAVDIPSRLAMLGMATVAALLPDIDHEQATINQKLKVTKALAWVIPHRGLTHSLWAIIGMAGLALFASERWGHDALWLAGVVAYASHLLADALTVQGIALFAPFSKWRFKLGRIRTGGLIERFLGMAIMLAFLGILVWELR